MLWLAVPLVCALADDARTPVVVELFTSEGCSSCPPADLLLANLEKLQPIKEADIIVLSEHVDYWDRQGWADPFASHFFTARQQMYAHTFSIEDVYTPQMVVNGLPGFTGNDGPRSLKEIRSAAAMSHASVTASRKNASTLAVGVDHMPDGAKNVEILLAITEDGLSSEVLRGENAGHKLSHTGVVRSLTSVTRFDVRKTPVYSADLPLNLHDDWNREKLHAVVLVQDHGTKRILGAARVGL